MDMKSILSLVIFCIVFALLFPALAQESIPNERPYCPGYPSYDDLWVEQPVMTISGDEWGRNVSSGPQFEATGIPMITWQRCLGGPGEDFGDAHPATDGGYIVVGSKTVF